ncbi:MAG: RNA polymerase sigma factor [Gemmatimonadota bacterium]
MPEDRDAPDVQRVLAGDLSAFEGIVRRWQGPLVNLAFRFCRDRSRAGEMAQEAFIKAYRPLRGCRADSAFSTWLFAVAANLDRSRMRRPTPPEDSLEVIAELADPRSAHGLPGEDRREMVHRAGASLPAAHRDAVILYYFLDMNVGAAARALGLPTGTIKARPHRGRDMWRRKLRPMFPSGTAPEET